TSHEARRAWNQNRTLSAKVLIVRGQIFLARRREVIDYGQSIVRRPLDNATAVGMAASVGIHQTVASHDIDETIRINRGSGSGLPDCCAWRIRRQADDSRPLQRACAVAK